MPHVRCVMLVTIDAPPATALDAVASRGGAHAARRRHRRRPVPRRAVRGLDARRVRAARRPTTRRTQLRLEARTDTVVPFFGWFVNLQARRRRPYRHEAPRRQGRGGDHRSRSASPAAPLADRAAGAVHERAGRPDRRARSRRHDRELLRRPAHAERRRGHRRPSTGPTRRSAPRSPSPGPACSCRSW